MPFVTCNKQSKRILSWARWQTLDFDPATEVGFSIDREVDENNEVWDDNTGLRPMTQAERDTESNNRKDRDADIDSSLDPLMKAIILTVFDEINTLRTNAGLPPRTITQLKNTIRGRL